MNVKVLHELSLRLVTIADAQMLYDWRNDPETRRASRQTEIIAWANHLDWLSATLASPECMIRIAEEACKPVGVVRVVREPNGWTLSWTVSPEARGQGLGRRMVSMFAASLGGRLIAIIRRDNVASIKIAAAAGLIRVGLADDKDFERWARE